MRVFWYPEDALGQARWVLLHALTLLVYKRCCEVIVSQAGQE
jgi:hypothetical protein